MSRIFSNINVRTNDQQAVAAAVVRLPRRMGAYVMPPVNGWVTVFEETSDAPDEDRLSGYTVMLSDKLKTQAVGFLVYESDVLIYTLAEDGKLLDHYSSWPDYFDESMPPEEYDRLSGQPKLLARVNPSIPPGKIAEALEGEHDFAEEKLSDLVGLLGLPANASRWGYNDILEAIEEPANEDTGNESEPPAELPEGWAAAIRLQNVFQTLT